MSTIDRGTHRLHYEVHGRDQATALLLIMRLSFSSRAWHNLPPRLVRSFRVITFDNAGSGRSTAPRRLRMPAMADDAAAVLDAVGADRAAVFGISMGGMVAIELALRHPGRLRALALGCTLGGYRRSKKPALGTMAKLSLATVLGKRYAPGKLARFLTTEAHYARDAAGFEAWLHHTEASRPLTAVRQMSAILRHEAEARLGEIKAPTLVLSGDQDLLVPVENSRRLARAIPGARLLELAGVGHCFPVERPDEVVRALEDLCLPQAHRAEGARPPA